MPPVAAYLGLFAVLIAGLIPSGWMPVTQDGKVQIVICTGEGVQNIWITPDSETQLSDAGHSPADNDHENRICPFATQIANVYFTADQLSLLLQGPGQDLWGKATFTHHSAGFHWRYDARGPPTFS